MSHQSTSALNLAPASSSADPADRRAYPRIQSAKLPITRVRIPNRPAVALVDLSSGGALLNLPFQVRPESRFPLQLDTASEPVTVPFQLIRCYVSTLRGGVTYSAAGAFDNLLDLQALAQRSSSAVSRLIDTLERMQRGVQKAALRSRSDAAFSEILGAAIVWLRRDESLDLVALKVKAHLTQTYPSLMIVPCLLPTRDEFNSVACFGLTLRSKHALSAHDRRVLKANAQLISMLEDTRLQMREEAAPVAITQVTHTPAEWLEMKSQPRLVTRPVSIVTKPAPMRTPPVEKVPSVDARKKSADESGLRALIESAMFQPAAV